MIRIGSKKAIESVAEERVLEELQELDPKRWFKVLDFVGCIFSIIGGWGVYGRYHRLHTPQLPLY